MNFPDDLFPEDAEHLKKLFDQMGSTFSTDDSISELCSAHPELADCLSEFDRESAVRLISALETIPNLLKNTIRIEVLLHLAVCCCVGSVQATTESLRQWVAFMDKSSMAFQEDPSEDVFIGYVCTSRGGFRVYQGIFSNADFIIERLIYFLAKKTEFPKFGAAYESVIELLRVSEAIANDLGQIRYSPGETPEGDAIPVPLNQKLAAHAKSVVFSSERITSLGIDSAKLEPFYFTPERMVDFDLGPLFGSTLELHPLFPITDEFLVASPSSLCRAAIVHILSIVPQMGGWADDFFGTESAEFFVNEILGRLGIKPNKAIRLPKPPKSLPRLFAFTGQFDFGMPVLALIKSSSFTEGINLEEMESFSHEQIAEFNSYVADCCEACESTEGFKGGMILLGLSSIGRPIAIQLYELRPQWHFFAAGLGDWQTLASDKDFNAKRLWYLGLQQDLSEKFNLIIVNTSGLLNLYAFWQSNDYALVHHSVDLNNPHNMLSIDGSYSSRLNTKIKSTYDRHCQISHDGNEWVMLQREGSGLNPDTSTNLMYVDHISAENGELRGCVIFKDSAWWVEAKKRPSHSDSRNLFYRLWDCVFNWVEHILPVMEVIHPNQKVKRLNLELEFVGIENWSVAETTKLRGSPANLTSTFDSILSNIKITFSQGFLEKFYRPDNLAEREIVTAILESTTSLASLSLNKSQIQQLVDQITKNQDTRFFHIVRSTSLESSIAGPQSAEPTFIPFEEISRARIGLAHRVKINPPGKITNSKEAQDFLDKIVANLQESVCDRLKQLNILPIVLHSFSQLDELSRDGSRWSLSTRSLLSLNGNAVWIQERLRSESVRLAFAEIANRILIETAVYSNNSKAVEYISQTEHASLLAQLVVMIELANHRDAIAGGFVVADLKIHPNGMVDYDETFQRHVFQPYLTSRIDDRIRWDADTYDDNFEQTVTSDTPSDKAASEIAAFERAFQAEYGFQYDALIKVIDYFDEQAITKGRASGTLSSMAFRHFLKYEIQLTNDQIDKFIDRFQLPIRPSWNAGLPKGCDVNDVLPWRYFRGVSVLIRPFVEVSRSPRTFVISAPHLHRWIRYLSQSIIEGLLPAKIFHSSVMKSYLGSIANKKGHEFTKETSAGIQSILYNQRVEIKMTELGASAMPDLGDIDILAWDHNSGCVFLIECKRLKAALTVRQVIQQLEDFKGDPNNNDYLAKHQRRVEWLQENPKKLSEITEIPLNHISWIPLLVTRGRVPMSFVDSLSFPKEQVVADQDLLNYIKNSIDR